MFYESPLSEKANTESSNLKQDLKKRYTYVVQGVTALVWKLSQVPLNSVTFSDFESYSVWSG